MGRLPEDSLAQPYKSFHDAYNSRVKLLAVFVPETFGEYLAGISNHLTTATV